MKRGQIYFIKSNYREEGSEQRADRPAVIVSNDIANEHSEVVEVVYLTTKPKNDIPTHVFTRSALSPSTILCEQIHTVSKQRVETLIGELTESELQALDSALMISLGIDLGAGPVEKEPAKEEQPKEKKQPHIPVPQDMAATIAAELIKAQTERDIYRDLYHDMLEHVKGATS